MSYGIGTEKDVGYGDPDAWGGPMNGVDVENHLNGVSATARNHRFSEDAYLAFMIIGALVLLWFFGTVAFKGNRM